VTHHSLRMRALFSSCMSVEIDISEVQINSFNSWIQSWDSLCQWKSQMNYPAFHNQRVVIFLSLFHVSHVLQEWFDYVSHRHQMRRSNGVLSICLPVPANTVRRKTCRDKKKVHGGLKKLLRKYSIGVKNSGILRRLTDR
jgi:hypothetical protein